jgi:hypothetical protein
LEFMLGAPVEMLAHQEVLVPAAVAEVQARC